MVHMLKINCYKIIWNGCYHYRYMQHVCPKVFQFTCVFVHLLYGGPCIFISMLYICTYLLRFYNLLTFNTLFSYLINTSNLTPRCKSSFDSIPFSTGVFARWTTAYYFYFHFLKTIGI